MLINPKIAVEKKWIYPVNDNQIHSNGIDLRLNRVILVGCGIFTLYKSGKKELTKYTELIAQDNFFFLRRLRVYYVEMIEKLNIPENVCALVIPKNILNRNGIILISDLFNPNFKNIINVSICPITNFKVEKEARIGQVIFLESQDYNSYMNKINEKNENNKRIFGESIKT